ncbi:Anaphase promoting complex subunit 7 [Mactra antiquata]
MYFEQLKLLHDSELYEDVKQMASIVLTLYDNNTYTELLSATQKYQCYVFYGNALYHLREYTKAEDLYKKALLLLKAINKTKGKSSQSAAVTSDITSDVEVKYKMYQCLVHTKQYKEAMSVLEGISTKQRTAKVNLALAKMYTRSGMDRSAITSYREVLRECPLALESINGLISLGLKATDVHSLVLNGLPSDISAEWLTQWMRGQSQNTSQEFVNAVVSFHYENQSCLKDNVYLITNIARALFLHGHYAQSLLTFRRAHAVDPLHIKHLDVFAYLLYKEKKVTELNSLCHQLMSASEEAAESWVANGYYALLNKKYCRAIYFAQKANNIDSTNVEALLLKATGLFELNKKNESVMHFQEAMRLAPHRYEAYKGLTDCYLATNRLREALGLGGRAIKTIGGNVRTLTLYGSIIAKSPTSMTKAKPYLEKAMKLDPTSLEPVYVMADVLMEEKMYDKGIELLRSYLQNQSTCRLHTLLADFLNQIGDEAEALEHFHKGLGLDRTNLQARQGLERIEKQGNTGIDSIDSNYDVEVDDLDTSGNGPDFGGSDVESTWSDTDFS